MEIRKILLPLAELQNKKMGLLKAESMIIDSVMDVGKVVARELNHEGD